MLIDGCVFSTPDVGTPARFWREVTPRLGKILGEPVFFLNRNGTALPFQADETVKVLHAPPADAADYPAEQRRLAALCAEMSVPLFASTRFTNAAPVKSVFVLTDDFPYLVNITAAGLLARQTAIESAALCVTLSDQAADYLASGYKVPRTRICRIADGDLFADVDLLASKFAAAVKGIG